MLSNSLVFLNFRVNYDLHVTSTANKTKWIMKTQQHENESNPNNDNKTIITMIRYVPQMN